MASTSPSTTPKSHFFSGVMDLELLVETGKLNEKHTKREEKSPAKVYMEEVTNQTLRNRTSNLRSLSFKSENHKKTNNKPYL